MIVIDPIPEYFNDNISPCDSNACLTCNSFISDQSFKSNLTGRIYKTQNYEQLTCGSSNVVYAIHCIQCGLMYVSKTGRSLQSRLNGHRAGIIKDGQSLLYKHFRLPGHSVADMKVQILEKIYHSSENPVNIRLHRRLQELYQIKELGTAAPYVFVPADKAPNNIIIICKRYYIETLIKELGLLSYVKARV